MKVEHTKIDIINLRLSNITKNCNRRSGRVYKKHNRNDLLCRFYSKDAQLGVYKMRAKLKDNLLTKKTITNVDITRKYRISMTLRIF